MRLDNGLTVVSSSAASSRRSAPPGFGGGAATSDPAGAVDLLRWLESQAGIAMPFNAVEATPIEGPAFTGDLVRAGTRNLSNALYLLAQRIVDTDKTDWVEMLDKERSQSPLTFRICPGEGPATCCASPCTAATRWPARRPVGDRSAGHPGRAHGALDPAHAQPEERLLAIVGNVEPAEGERLARTWFGSWQAPEGVVPATLPPCRPRRVDPEASTPAHGRRTATATPRSSWPSPAACPPPTPAPGPATPAGQRTGRYINTMVRFRAGAAYAVNTRDQLPRQRRRRRAGDHGPRDPPPARGAGRRPRAVDPPGRPRASTRAPSASPAGP